MTATVSAWSDSNFQFLDTFYKHKHTSLHQDCLLMGEHLNRIDHATLLERINKLLCVILDCKEFSSLSQGGMRVMNQHSTGKFMTAIAKSSSDTCIFQGGSNDKQLFLVPFGRKSANGFRRMREVNFSGNKLEQKEQLEIWYKRSQLDKATFNANTNWEPKIYMNRPDRTLIQNNVKKYVKHVVKMFNGNKNIKTLYVTTIMERADDSIMVQFAKAAFNDYLRRYITTCGKGLALYNVQAIDIRGAYFRANDASGELDLKGMYCQKNLWRAEPDLIHRNAKSMLNIFANYIAPILKKK